MTDTQLLQLFIDWVENETEKQGYNFPDEKPVEITDPFNFAIAVNSLRHHRMGERDE